MGNSVLLDAIAIILDLHYGGNNIFPKNITIQNIRSKSIFQISYLFLRARRKEFFHYTLSLNPLTIKREKGVKVLFIIANRTGY